MFKINYTGSSKVIIRLCEIVNSIIDALSGKADVNDIPTKTSDLTNDSGFITENVSNLANYYLKFETYTQAEVNSLISAIQTMHFEVVEELPSIPTPTNYSVYFLWSDLPGGGPREYAFVWRGSNIYKIPISSLVKSTVLEAMTDWTPVDELPTSPSDTATYYWYNPDTDADEICVYVSNKWNVVASISSEDWEDLRNCEDLDWDTYGEESNPEFRWDNSTIIVADPSALQFPDTNAIYLLPSSDPQQQNVYDEYIFVPSLNNYEKIGTTAIDLSNYVTITMLNTALADYVTSADFQTALADYYTATEVDTLLADKADASDIPTALADLTDDSTHRTVTDTEKTTWNGKSVVSANPQTTTGTLTGIEIDGVSYAIQSGSQGTVTSVNNITPDQNGNVSIDAEDVGALPDDTPLFSGDYNDLQNKPTIPDELADLQDDSTHRLVTDTEKATWNGKSDFSGSYNDLTDKPTIPDELADLADDATHRTVTDTEKSTWNAKSDFSGSYNDLTDKPTIPAAQIQSDWAQNDSTALDYIKNKPTIPSVPVTSVNGQTGAVVLDADDVGALPDDTPLFSGDYDDLTNKPTIPSVSANPQSTTDTLNAIEIDGVGYAVQGGGAVTSVNGQTGAVVLDADDVGALPDSTVIPSKTSDLQNDSGYISDLDNAVPTVTEATTRTNLSVGDTVKIIIGKIKKWFTDLKTVAFTGSYNDLTDKPTIPAAQVNADWNATSGVAQILNKPTLATVATSGSYADLSNKPTIPTVNNATLTIQKNGTNVQTFTANQSTNATANITVPTKVSELTNDSGYTTNTGTVTQVKVGTTAYNPSSGVVSLPAYPTTLPASDVYAWAKAATKPNYYYKELLGEDTRSVNSAPSAYQTKNGGTEFIEFKSRATIGAPGSSTYGVLKTINPWGDSSGGLPVQIYTDNTGIIAFRPATSTTAWGAWRTTPNEDHYVNFGTTASGTNYILIQIKSTVGWMLSFDVNLYSGYVPSVIRISGYQYGANYWYSPNAQMIIGPATSVTFGYSSANNLWVAIQASSYVGASITNVVNGYVQTDKYNTLFDISRVTSLPATIQTTVTAAAAVHAGDNISNFTNNSGYITSSGTAANVSGTVAIANGGTGATTAANARANLAVPGCVQDSNGFPTITKMNGAGSWIRAAASGFGFIPFKQAARNAGADYLGTSAWYFGHAYIDKVHSANVVASLSVSGSTITAKDVDGNTISTVTPTATWSGGTITSSGNAYSSSSAEVGWYAGFGSTRYLALVGGKSSGKTGLLDVVADTWVLEGANSTSGYNKWLYHGKLGTNRFQCGTVTVSSGSLAVGVTFSSAFAGVPKVVCTSLSSSAYYVRLTSVTATNFSIVASGACTVHWMAYYDA